MNQRTLFFKHLAQTSATPMAIEITKSRGSKIWSHNKKLIDLIGGIGVNNIGHSHPKVIKAVEKQMRKYAHIMVYGECIMSPQTSFAKLLTDYLPSKLDSVYFTNSGTEACEGALKLCKKKTGRKKIIAFNNCYHGSSTGALSLIGDKKWRDPYQPLLPDVIHFNYNSEKVFDALKEDVAGIFIEPIQAESGIIPANKKWLKKICKLCSQKNIFVIIDENQSALGRTGDLWAFQKYDIVPDILILGKALGGGLPLGAFIASKENMQTLSENPALGHITTFGGNPICCEAGKAAFEILIKKNISEIVKEKRNIFLSLLKHPQIKKINSIGLWFAIELKNKTETTAIINKALKKGVFIDSFLFAPHCLRICPSLLISKKEIQTACKRLFSCL